VEPSQPSQPCGWAVDGRGRAAGAPDGARTRGDRRRRRHRRDCGQGARLTKQARQLHSRRRRHTGMVTSCRCGGCAVPLTPRQRASAVYWRSSACRARGAPASSCLSHPRVPFSPAQAAHGPLQFLPLRLRRRRHASSRLRSCAAGAARAGGSAACCGMRCCCAASQATGTARRDGQRGARARDGRGGGRRRRRSRRGRPARSSLRGPPLWSSTRRRCHGGGHARAVWTRWTGCSPRCPACARARNRRSVRCGAVVLSL
jgi:hypothetical protein